MKHVQFITHTTERFTYLDSARMALEGGCRWIQLRMKECDECDIKRTARELIPMCRAAGAIVIIDDYVELAIRMGADGVHLGRNDMPLDQARRLAPRDFIIGGTANTFDDVARLARLGADYIGCGPFRFTTTKKNLSPVLGLGGYRTIVGRMRSEGINLPIVAIGGICLSDIPSLMATGVSGIAVSGGVLRAENPVAQMGRIIEAVEG